jgi:hypothetical protein
MIGGMSVGGPIGGVIGAHLGRKAGGVAKRLGEMDEKWSKKKIASMKKSPTSNVLVNPFTGEVVANVLGMALGKVRNPLQDAVTQPFRKKKTTVGGVLKGGLTGVRNSSHLGLLTPSKARKRKLISSAEQDAKKRGLVFKPVGSFR